MSWIAIVLVMVSAGMHAGWNLLSKKEHPTTAFFLLCSIFGLLIYLPVLGYFNREIMLLPLRIWLLLLATSIAMTVYYASLAGAYRSGHMTLAYPLARSSPVIVVAVISVLLGRGDQVSWQCVIGIFMVVGGCFVLPMKKITEFNFKNYLNITCLLALLAACGTAGYSIIDDEAMREMRKIAGLGLNKPSIAFLYAGLESPTTISMMSVVVLVTKSGRESLRNVLRKSKSRSLVTGLSINVTYLLILISMAFTVNVSYIVAFRQISIPLGVLLGITILKEPKYTPKFIGTAIIFIGLILVGTG